jgi:hypothetical protein
MNARGFYLEDRAPDQRPKYVNPIVSPSKKRLTVADKL